MNKIKLIVSFMLVTSLTLAGCSKGKEEDTTAAKGGVVDNSITAPSGDYDEEYDNSGTPSDNTDSDVTIGDVAESEPNLEFKEVVAAREGVEQLLRRSFRPEFLNRLDEIVFYKPLTRENIGFIVELLLKDLRERLEEKQLHLSLTEAAKDYFADAGYDPNFGARPLRRLMQQQLETLIARRILRGDLQPDMTLNVDYKDGKLIL